MDDFAKAPIIDKQTGIAVAFKSVDKDLRNNKIVAIVADSHGAELKIDFATTGDYADIAKNNVNKIKKILKIESIFEAKGKAIGIHVNKNNFVYKKGPKTGQKGVGYNVCGYFPVESLSEGTNESGEEKVTDEGTIGW